MREIRFRDLNETTTFLVVFGVIGLTLSIILFCRIIDINKELDNLPHKVCINETNYGKEFQLVSNNISLGLKDYETKKYSCSEGRTECTFIRNYSLDYDKISNYTRFYFNSVRYIQKCSVVKNTTCVEILGEKEICSWRDSEGRKLE